MKLETFIKNISILEMILFFIFIIYLVFPVQTPDNIAPFIDSSIGLLVLFFLTMYLFLYTQPILGIVFLFVAYELIRRSTKIVKSNALIQYIPSQTKKNKDLIHLNPVPKDNLEEQIVETMAPVGKSSPIIVSESTFQPVLDNSHFAAPV